VQRRRAILPVVEAGKCRSGAHEEAAMASWKAVASRLGTAKAEMGSAIAALSLAFGEAIVLLGAGGVRLRADNAAAGFFVAVFLGPLLSLAGAWLDLRQRQSLGVMLLALAALLALDGSFAYFIGLPTFLLVAASFGSAMLRRGTQAIQQA
jgi:hypothetical protein